MAWLSLSSFFSIIPDLKRNSHLGYNTPMEMTSNQPYLFRAIYDWIVDNGATPYMVVDAMGEYVRVPRQSVQNGQIVLNIAPRAVTNYMVDDEAVSFSARFSGVSEHIYVPVENILALYAAENGQGMVFSQDAPAPSDSESQQNEEAGVEETEIEETSEPVAKQKTDSKKGRKSHLKVIK